jgi:hypothetical protein
MQFSDLLGNVGQSINHALGFDKPAVVTNLLQGKPWNQNIPMFGGSVQTTSVPVTPPPTPVVPPKTFSALATATVPTVPVTPAPAGTNPYTPLIAQYFPNNQSEINQAMFKESSNNPRLIHSNSNVFNSNEGVQVIPTDNQAAVVPSTFTRAQWASLRHNHPNLDVGLLQINTDPQQAMANYLISKGLTFYDLLDPAKNVQIAADLYNGKIPGKAAGINNWVSMR